MNRTQPRVDSTPAVIGFGLLFAGAALLLATAGLGQPLSRAAVVQALLVGWFTASVGLRAGDHLVRRLERQALPEAVDGHLPGYAVACRCGTCGHLAVLATDGWTHHAVLDTHPVVPEAVAA